MATHDNISLYIYSNTWVYGISNIRNMCVIQVDVSYGNITNIRTVLYGTVWEYSVGIQYGNILWPYVLVAYCGHMACKDST